MDADHFEERLTEALARLRASEARPTGSRVTGIDTLWRRDRPGSIVAGVRLILEDGPSSVVVKVPKIPANATPARREKIARRLQHEFDSSRLFHELLLDAPNCGGVKPVAVFLDIPAIVVEQVLGASVQDLLEDRARWWSRRPSMALLENACRLAGRLLTQLQDRSRLRERQFDLDGMIDYVGVRVERLRSYGPLGLDQESGREVLAAFERSRGAIDDCDRRVAAIHWDYCPSNTLFADGRLTVIDCSACSSGSVVLDLTRFHHQLGLLLMDPRFRPAAIRRCQEALLEGYGQPEIEHSRLFALFTVQHLLCHWLGRLKSGSGTWRQRAAVARTVRGHRLALQAFLENRGPAASRRPPTSRLSRALRNR